MSMEQQYAEKNKRMAIAMNNGIPDRVPILSIIDNWAFSYSGYSIDEIFEDDEKHLAAFDKVARDFYWDSMFTVTTTRPINYISALGGGAYKAKGTLQIESGSILSMDAEEYPELAEDPYKFLLEVIAPRKYELFRKPYSEEKYQEYCDAVDHYFAFRNVGARSAQALREKYGVPVSRGAVFFHPLDMILDYLRDFQGTMFDIKRKPKQIREVCDAMLPMVIEMVEGAYPEPVEGKYIFNPMHLPEFISARDFEKVYWPTYKKLMDYFTDKGYNILCYYERSYAHLFEFLQDLPKNKIVGLFEDDDLRIVKEKLGDMMCFAGGMKTFDLNYSSKQVCLDQAKSLIDDLAGDGGYIFTTDRIPHSDNDANPENLRAVNEFVRDYGVYK